MLTRRSLHGSELDVYYQKYFLVILVVIYFNAPRKL